jgi:hypothetical protein
VKCEDEVGAIEDIEWNKINAMGIIEWRGGDVSWWSIKIILILKSSYDTLQCFDVGEIARFAMPIHTN